MPHLFKCISLPINHNNVFRINQTTTPKILHLDFYRKILTHLVDHNNSFNATMRVGTFCVKTIFANVSNKIILVFVGSFLPNMVSSHNLKYVSVILTLSDFIMFEIRAKCTLLALITGIIIDMQKSRTKKMCDPFKQSRP